MQRRVYLAKIPVPAISRSIGPTSDVATAFRRAAVILLELCTPTPLGSR